NCSKWVVCPATRSSFCRSPRSATLCFSTSTVRAWRSAKKPRNASASKSCKSHEQRKHQRSLDWQPEYRQNIGIQCFDGPEPAGGQLSRHHGREKNRLLQTAVQHKGKHPGFAGNL